MSRFPIFPDVHGAVDFPDFQVCRFPNSNFECSGNFRHLEAGCLWTQGAIKTGMIDTFAIFFGRT